MNTAKILFGCLMTWLPVEAGAQLVTYVSMDDTHTRLQIEYTPATKRVPKVEISENGGQWKPFNAIIQPESEQEEYNTVDCDIFSEYPNGVSNARFRVQGFTAEDLESIDTSRLPSGLSPSSIKSGIVCGPFAYFYSSSSSSRYAGDLRKGTRATATDQVTVTADAYIYDLINHDWQTMDNVCKWSGRVPRKTHDGLFPKPSIPYYHITVSKDGRVWLGDELISNDKIDEIRTSTPTTVRPLFSRYAKTYVEQKINVWQQKGEFEKTVDYKARIRNERDAMIATYVNEAKKLFITKTCPPNLRAAMTLGKYDVDNEVFLVTTERFGDLLVPVPVSDAPKFKKEWEKVAVEPDYQIENDELVLASAAFRPNRGKSKKAYIYQKGSDVEYSIPEIAFNFSPIEIDVPKSETETSSPSITRNRLEIGNLSDVDTDIPKGSRTANANTFAVVISNENYRRVSPVDYAHNDGRSVRNYLSNTLGLADDHIHHIEDATLNDIRNEIDWLKGVGQAYNGDASFIVYYAGHGLPNDADGSGYLLPVDGYGSNVATGMAMNQLADDLGSINSKITLVMLDACFSGTKRGGDMISAERGIALKVKPHNAQKGNLVIISASQDDQTASKFDDKYHGLFTYYMLKHLQSTQGQTTIGEMVDDIKTNVNRQSIVANNKTQTPSVTASPALNKDWREIHLSELSR